MYTRLYPYFSGVFFGYTQYEIPFNINSRTDRYLDHEDTLINDIIKLEFDKKMQKYLLSLFLMIQMVL